jgi:hypothetical protein
LRFFPCTDPSHFPLVLFYEPDVPFSLRAVCERISNHMASLKRVICQDMFQFPYGGSRYEER